VLDNAQLLVLDFRHQREEYERFLHG
jgi:hypothetical protein